MADPVLAGRGAIITGGSTGLGYAIAEAFVEAVAHIAICARNRPELEAARDALARRARTGQVVMAEAADVSRPEDVARLVGSASNALPGIDVLVNNAGILGPIGRFEDVEWAEWVR